MDKTGTGDILIVEDNEINLQLIKKTIERLGAYRIDIARNGEEAVERFKENAQDIIFMDIQLPVMNGLEAFEKIEKICHEEKRERPVVIAMTAYAMKGDRERFLDAGMDSYLSKPFEFKDVENILININSR